MRSTAGLLCLLGRLCSARECGSAEIEARDITGCVKVWHVKYLGHTNAIWLGNALHHNADLEELDLHHTKLGDEDAKSLAAGLHNNTKLRWLAMHNNHIHDEGAMALGEALAENDVLEVLSLSSNGVGDAGAIALAAGLRKNRALRRLDLYFNLVGDAGASALADALMVNRGLRILHLDTNSVGETGGLALARALSPPPRGIISSLMGSTPQSSSPPALAELTMLYNHLTNTAAIALAGAARANQALHSLDATHNHMVHGEAKEEQTAVMVQLKARNALAKWLVDHNLIEGRWHAKHGPPLSSPYAQAVGALQAHTTDGLLALRHENAESLASRSELATLAPAQRQTLARLLLDLVGKATARDEL